ncbi:microsomal triacylglycerol transfer protein, partial [Oratosquilla oratoria]|uniref:microsomal triacylglycerol transfer protein n=1 Tax=Oratosquilla oratoria TaxID=337810 RepID=UPI003F75DA69
MGLREGAVLFLLMGIFATPCLQAPASSRQFELGTRYEYDYSTKVLLDEPPVAATPPTSKDVGFKVHLKAEVTPVWQNPSTGLEQLLELKVTKPELSVRSRQGPDPEGFVGKSSRLQEKRIPSIYLLRAQGRVTALYHTEDHDLGSLNVMKGIASLLQYQATATVESEVDASGSCDVTYKVIDSNHLSKSKKNCRPVHQSVASFNHTKQVLSAVVDSSAVTSYELSPEDKVVASATSLETHVLRVEIRRTSGGQVSSRQDLVLQKRSGASSKLSGLTAADAVAEASKQRRQTLVTSNLATAVEPKECIACRTLPELLSNYRNSLKSSNLATQSAAIGFLRVLRKVRDSQLADIKKMLKSKKNKDILPQLVDVCALAQTVASH